MATIIPFILFVLYFWATSLLDVFNIKINKLQRSYIFVISFLLLAVFAGGRWSNWEVGYDAAIFDYSTYKNIYNSSLDILNFFEEYLYADVTIKSNEPGYIFYSSLCNLILGNNFNVFLLFTNLILTILLCKSLKNNMADSAIFFVLYFFASRLYLQYNFILLRQAIALFIIWTWGFPTLVNGNKKKFVFIVLIAVSFHISSAISLLALLLNKKYNLKTFYVIISIFFLLNISGILTPIIFIIMEKGISIFVGGGIGEKISQYLLGDEMRGMNLLSLVEPLPLLFVTIKYREQLENDKFGLFYMNMFYLFLLLMVITMNFGFLTRLCQFFMFSYIFLISFYYKASLNSTNKRIYLFLASIYLLVYSIRYIFIWFYDSDYAFFLFKI